MVCVPSRWILHGVPLRRLRRIRTRWVVRWWCFLGVRICWIGTALLRVRVRLRLLMSVLRVLLRLRMMGGWVVPRSGLVVHCVCRLLVRVGRGGVMMVPLLLVVPSCS
jgi:hypothetical protein